MAEAETVVVLRRMIDEPDAETYSDMVLAAILDSTASTEQAAARVWAEKAAKYASLVTRSEVGSSESLSDLHKNAINMAKYYDSLLVAEEAATPSRAPFTSTIERA